jgi:hypothetical protein
MDATIRHIAEPTHVREVTLRGTADLAFWATRLQQEELLPVNRNGTAQILNVAAEMIYIGIRFTEFIFSEAVVNPPQKKQDAAFLVTHPLFNRIADANGSEQARWKRLR